MKLIRTLSVAASILFVPTVTASAASAATTVSRCDSGNINSTTGCNIVFDGTSGTYGNANVAVSSFVDIYNFDLSSAGKLGLTLSSVGMAPNSDISFSLVRLNPAQGGGGDVPLSQGSTGTVDFYSLSNLAAVAGTYKLRLEGTVAGNMPNAAYSGTISFAPTGAVPEPASWAMMIVGMGAIGFAMRNAKRRSEDKFDAKIKKITYGAIA